MSDLTIGLLGALLATNQPQAVSNLVQQQAGVSVAIANPTDPTEQELEGLMEDDDAALAEVDRWIQMNNALVAKGAGETQEVLNQRIHARLNTVRTNYASFLRRHPDSARGYLAYGTFLDDIGDEEGGKVQFENAAQIDPKNPAVWNNLANYYGENSPVTNAFVDYAKAIELDPTEPVYFQNLATTVYMFRKDARAFYGINEQQVFDKALALYRQAIQLDPTNFELATDYAESYYGIKPMRTNDALVAWTNALAAAGNDIEREGVFIHLARVKITAGRFDEARAQLDAVTNDYYADLKKLLERNANEREHAVTNAVPEISTTAPVAIANSTPPADAVDTETSNRGTVDKSALESFQKISKEYEDYKAANASSASTRPDSVSLQVVGGLRYVTKYIGEYIGAVKLSDQETEKSEALLEKDILETFQIKTNASSPWLVLVKCNQNTGAKLGGGAIWEVIPSAESDEDLKNAGIHLGLGASVQPLVTGSVFLVNTKEKLLVSQIHIYAAGKDVDSALRSFAEAVNNEYSK